MMYLCIIGAVMAGYTLGSLRKSAELARNYAESAMITLIVVVMAFYAEGVLG